MRNELFQVQIVMDKQPLAEHRSEDKLEWRRAVIVALAGKQYGIYLSLLPLVTVSNECTFRYEIEINNQTVRKGIFIKSRNHFVEGMRQGTTVLPFKFSDTHIPGTILVKFWRCRIAENVVPTRHQLHLMKKKLVDAGTIIFCESVNRSLPKYYEHVDLDSSCLIFEYEYHFDILRCRKRSMDEQHCNKRVKL